MQRPTRDKAELGYSPSSKTQVQLAKPIDILTNGGLKFVFVQGQMSQPELVTIVNKGKAPQQTSQPKVKAVLRVVEPSRGNPSEDNPMSV